MKQFIAFLILLCSYVLCGAQATSLTVDNKIAGTLSQRILYDDKLTIENLKVIGEINTSDFDYIKELNSHCSLKGVLDLSDIVMSTLNVNDLSSLKFNKIIVPKSITEWNDGDYLVPNGSAGYATHYPNMEADSLIIDCPNLKSVGNGIGNPYYLYVGEGIQSLALASKYLGRVPGASDDFYVKARDSMCIVLPATLKSISGNKRMGSPKVKIYSKILNPDELSTDTSTKWYDEVFVKGFVYAPNDTKKLYENSIFKHLEIIAPISVKNVGLSIHSLTLQSSEKYVLDVVVSPSDADNKEINWSSSDESIVSVDNSGNITALKGGVAKITVASVENLEIKDECTVTVIQPVTGITLNKTALELIEDDTEKLVATIAPEDASNKSVKWTSSDISVAMVSADGSIYAVKPGQATIMVTAEDGGFVALCKVTVKARTVLAESLSIESSNSDLTVGDTRQLTAIVLPETTTNKNVRWTSTNSDIATVSESGLVTAFKEGKAQIIATTIDGSNLSAIYEITIKRDIVPVTQISIVPATVTLKINETLKLEAQILPNVASNKSISWSSANSGVATVSSDGLITANGVGLATIIASTQDGTNLSATCTVIVENVSGIENIYYDNNAVVKIFNLQGVLVYEGVYSSANLASGTYVIIYNGKAYKRVVI